MNSKKSGFMLFVICFFMFFVPSITVRADMGPKPSLQIQFTGIEGKNYYGTILSGQNSTRFSKAWDGTETNAVYKEEDYEIWKKFADYEDKDGFHFFQIYSDCSENNLLSWRRDPPERFKILLYFPESDTYYESPIYRTYAFHSYFKVDMSDYPDIALEADRNYNYTWETVSLTVRIVITILLELFVALQFGYREKKLLRFFAGVNIITQIILNVLLNVVNYRYGFLAYAFVYVLLEFIVFAIEAVVYAALINYFSTEAQRRSKAVLYALTANAASFGIGIVVSFVIPGIFY